MQHLRLQPRCLHHDVAGRGIKQALWQTRNVLERNGDDHQIAGLCSLFDRHGHGPGLSGDMKVTIRGPADIDIAELTSITSTTGTAGLSFIAVANSNAALGARTVILQNAKGDVTTFTGGLEVVPVTYTDNYVTLWPGESVTLTAKYTTTDLGGQPAYLRVRGYNVPTVSLVVP